MNSKIYIWLAINFSVFFSPLQPNERFQMLFTSLLRLTLCMLLIFVSSILNMNAETLIAVLFWFYSDQSEQCTWNYHQNKRKINKTNKEKEIDKIFDLQTKFRTSLTTDRSKINGLEKWPMCVTKVHYSTHMHTHSTDWENMKIFVIIINMSHKIWTQGDVF